MYLFASCAETIANCFVLLTRLAIFTGRTKGTFIIYDDFELLYCNLLFINHILVHNTILLHKFLQFLQFKIQLPLCVSGVSLFRKIVNYFLNLELF